MCASPQGACPHKADVRDGDCKCMFLDMQADGTSTFDDRERFLKEKRCTPESLGNAVFVWLLAG